MAIKDIGSEIKPIPSLLPQTITTGNPDGTGVDVSKYNAVAVELICGAQSGTSNTFQIQESDDNSTFAVPAVADVIADNSTTYSYQLTITTANDNMIHRFKYIGSKRYIRVSCSANSSGNGLFAANVIVGHPKEGPATAWNT